MKLDANQLFCLELRYFGNIMKKMVPFFLTEQSIVKDGELIPDLLIYSFLAVTYFCWLVDVFVGAVVVFVVVVFLFSFSNMAAWFQARTS